MIDIKLIRETPDVIRNGLRKREADPTLVDQILEIDVKRREKIAAVDTLKNERNVTSKQIGVLRKEGKDTTEIQAAMRSLGDRIAELDKEAAALDEQQRAILLSLPNMPAPGVVAGGKEANAVMFVAGDGKPPVFDFEPQNHVDLCTKLGLIDYERGVRMGGSTTVRTAVFQQKCGKADLVEHHADIASLMVPSEDSVTASRTDQHAAARSAAATQQPTTQTSGRGSHDGLPRPLVLVRRSRVRASRPCRCTSP